MRLYGNKDGVGFEKVLSYHKCGETDYAKFYPVEPDHEAIITEIKHDENRGFFCVDSLDNKVEVYGGLHSKDYQRVDIVLVPCNYLHAGFLEDFIPEECIADYDAQLAHLGPINFLLYVNNSSFNPQGFNREAIHRTSILINVQGNASIPSFINYNIMTGRVNDDISMIQLGDVHEHFFYTYEASELTPQYSSWITYPTAENPSNRFKFISLEFHFKKDISEINR